MDPDAGRAGEPGGRGRRRGARRGRAVPARRVPGRGPAARSTSTRSGATSSRPPAASTSARHAAPGCSTCGASGSSGSNRRSSTCTRRAGSATTRIEVRDDAAPLREWEHSVASRLGLGVAVDDALALGHRRDRGAGARRSATRCATGSPWFPGLTLRDLGTRALRHRDVHHRRRGPVRARGRVCARGPSTSGVSTIDFARIDFERARPRRRRPGVGALLQHRRRARPLRHRARTVVRELAHRRELASLRGTIPSCDAGSSTGAARRRTRRATRTPVTPATTTAPPAAATIAPVRTRRRGGATDRFGDRLLVRVPRRPARGARACRWRHPRVHEVRHDARRHVADAERPRALPARASSTSSGNAGTDGRRDERGAARRRRASRRRRRCRHRGGRSVAASASADARSSTCTTCTGIVGAPHAQRRPPEEDARREPLGARARRPVADRSVVHDDVGMSRAPLGEQPLDLGALHRGRERRVRAQRRRPR